MSGDLQERTVTISGVKVVFPCKPYPSQFGMMDKVIKGLERSQNCLLESPTGSGKSLALLCSALAWQCAQHEKITRENMAASMPDTECCKQCTCGAESNKDQIGSATESKGSQNIAETTEKGDAIIPIIISEDEDDDFKPSSKFRSAKQGQSVPKRGHVKIGYETDETKFSPPPKCTCNMNPAGGAKIKKQKVPKIFFGTRTHKQIAQIARELGKTAYHDVRMAILGSREYTCIHPEVVKLKNKSEGCKERLDVNGAGCKFNEKSKRVFLNQSQLQEELQTSWDLEDLVGACKDKKACPYFVIRNIFEGADIIFCPYNYLIDPLVRKSMEIELKDQIIIIDEAHNIEDSARDAASASVTTDQITQAIHNIQELLDHNVKFAAHLCLKQMLEKVMQLVEDNSNNLQQADFDTSFKVWAGFDIVAHLKSVGLGPDNFAKYQSALELAGESEEDQQTTLRNQRNQEVKLSSSTLSLLETLRQMLDYMYRHELRFVEDYRLVIMKTMQFVPYKEMNGAWLGKNRRGGSRVQVHTLNFWCMNPAVAFSDFGTCRNVILSSGTLSPMSSFASELGTPFPIQLEANHVIQDKQVWVGAVGTGPGGTQLQAVYKNMETFTFQDELGNLVEKICTSVPHGVLCFFPSYRALEKFTERWKLTKVWSRIASRKRILIEPRRGDKEDFDNMMKAFYDVVKGHTSSGYLTDDHYEVDDNDIDGAIFFAVCRGKVSEGMDFADNNARAVITVGIPYPSIKDLQVKLKREYNDKHRVDRGLLSGNEWYEIQAFRALNQALGRCIRHRKDWGALIAVDDRFIKSTAKYTKGLSKWVRNKVQTFEAFNHFLSSLVTFKDRMIKEMPVISADTSFIPCTPDASQRRESVYKRCSLDTSGMDTSGMDMSLAEPSQSQYFSTPVSQTKTTRTLFQSPAQSKLVKPDNSSIENGGNRKIIVNNGGADLSDQQLLMQVINSSTAPKDQPYYVILNKGQPNEQTFLIEPTKKGSKNGNTDQKDKLPPNQLQPQVPMSSPPAVVPPTSQQMVFAPRVTSSMLVSPPGQTSQQVVEAAGIVNNQLLLIQSPPMVGLPLAVAPGQSLFAPQQLVLPASSAVHRLTTGEPAVVQQNPVPGSVPSSTQLVTTDAIATEGGSCNRNKFLKFCNLPNTPTRKQPPVAMVTPQCMADASQQKLQSDAPDVGSTVGTPSVAPPWKSDHEYGAGDIKTESSHTDNEHKQDIDDSKEAASEDVKKKKPLFRKAPKVTSGEKVGGGSCDDEKTIKMEHANGLIDNADKRQPAVKANIAPAAVDIVENHEAVEHKNDEPKSIADKLKRFRRFSTDDEINEPDRSVTVESKAIHAAKDNGNSKPESSRKTVLKDAMTDLKNNINDSIVIKDQNSEDEEFLNTRRKSVKKRRSTSLHRNRLKRNKGVEYEEEEDKMKENKHAREPTLYCATCGSVWIKQADFERRKRRPCFLESLSKRNEDWLWFSSLDIKYKLMALCSSVEGMTLDSMYDEATGCSVQFLHCGGCDQNEVKVIGAKVMVADSGSDYVKGQTWIMASATKM